MFTSNFVLHGDSKSLKLRITLNRKTTEISVPNVFVEPKDLEKALDIASRQQCGAGENRIISIHQLHLRPIVRGKAKARVEFGAKIGVSVVNGFTYIGHHSWEAYNETSTLRSI